MFLSIRKIYKSWRKFNSNSSSVPLNPTYLMIQEQQRDRSIYNHPESEKQTISPVLTWLGTLIILSPKKIKRKKLLKPYQFQIIQMLTLYSEWTNTYKECKDREKLKKLINWEFTHLAIHQRTKQSNSLVLAKEINSESKRC